MAVPVAFGPYELLEKVAVGGMAEVWRARLKNSTELLAVKRILPLISADSEFITMFLNEARLSLQLIHPGVVKMRELGESEGGYFLAMEFVAGQNLRSIMERFQERTKSKTWELPLLFTGNVILRVAEALDYVHKKTDPAGKSLDIVHRDVSPENILVSYDGQVKLIDFGIAKAKAKAANLTRVGLIKGKLAYLSPEQSRSQPLDGRSDVFALGAVFHELLTGRSLFLGDSEFDTVANVRDKIIPKPSSLREGISPALDSIIGKALERDLTLRYASAGALANDLRELLKNRAPFTAEDMAAMLHETFPEEWEKEKRVAAELAGLPPAPVARSSPTMSGARAPGASAVRAPPAASSSVVRPPAASAASAIRPPAAGAASGIRPPSSSSGVRAPPAPARPAARAPSVVSRNSVPAAPAMVASPAVASVSGIAAAPAAAPASAPEMGDFAEEKTEMADRVPVASESPRSLPRPAPPAKKAGPGRWAVLGVVVAVAAAAAFFVVPKLSHNAAKGYLVINASPPQATVTLDGEVQTDPVPLVLTVPEGTHQVDVEAAGFQTFHSQVLVSADSKTTVDANLVFGK